MNRATPSEGAELRKAKPPITGAPNKQEVVLPAQGAW